VGSSGFRVAATLNYRPGEVICEVGSEREEGSTSFLACVAPVVSIDVDPAASARAGLIANVAAICGRAEDVARDWGDRVGRPVRFAWLDGHDWPYDHHRDEDYEWQRAEYEARGQEWTQAASRASHLEIADGLRPWFAPGAIAAFDDTWYEAGEYRGKGGAAVPLLLRHGFALVGVGDIYHGLAVLRAPG
jgi:hypothetical protein